MKFNIYIYSLLALLMCCFTSCKQEAREQETTIATPIKPVKKFGFDMSQYQMETKKLKFDQFLASILGEHGISPQEVYKLEKKADTIFSVRNIRAGKDYHLMKKDSASRLSAFVYEESPLRYVIYDFRDSIDVNVVNVPYDICIEEATGTIESSLWNAMIEGGHRGEVIDLMEDALASQVSFYHTKKGDQFKAIYEKKQINGETVGLGNMIGAWFKNKYGEYYSVYFDSKEYEGFYDLEGRPSKKSFLRSPIRAGRISSRYNLRRLHPIKKRRIPHKGTDYAAPYGTKIQAVSNGVVIKRGRTRGNGKYIKIKHDGTYSSQYLHMQRFVKGLNVGDPVIQGQTIGYVGSTGLATGPHVCFRFWKNGRQIDHLRENFPPADPMPNDQLPLFYKHRDTIINQLKELEFIEKQLIETADTSEIDKSAS